MANFFDQFETKENFFDKFDVSATAEDQLLGAQSNIASSLINAAAVPLSGAAGALAGAVVGAGNIMGLTDMEGSDVGAEVVKGVQKSAADFASGMNTSPAAQQQMQVVGQAAQAVDENIIKPAVSGTAGLANIAMHPASNIAQGFEPALQTVQAVQEQGLSKSAGSQVLEATGSPLAATIMESLPTAAEVFISGKQLLKSVNKPALARKKIIAEEIMSGNPNIDNVTSMLNKKGDVITNKVAIKAIKDLGGEKPVIDLVTVFDAANPRTKTQIKSILDVIKQGEKKPLFKQDNRPSDILGKSISDRARDINKLNKNAGVKIGAIADELKGTKVDIQPQIVKFFDDMEDLGVTFKRGDDNWITPDFSRSKFKGGSKQEMSVLINDLSKGDFNFKTAHKLKQEIRSNLNYDKIGKDKIIGSGESLLRDLSSNIDSVLDTKSKRYDIANKKYAKTIGLVEKFDKMVGKDIDIFSDMSAEGLSKVSRQLASNNANRPVMKQTLQDTDKILKEFKINYKDDISTLVYATNELENMFNVVPARTFDSGIARGTSMALEATTSPALSVAKFADKMFTKKINFDDKIKALELLLEGNR